MLSFSDFMKVFEAYQSYSASQAVAPAPVAPVAPVAPAPVAPIAPDQYASLDARLKMLEQVTPSIATTQVTNIDDIISKLV